MRIRLSLLMLLCMALPSLAATGLTGTLVDASTGKAVADANVLLRDQAIFVTTGSDGTFTISNAAPGTDVLEIIANGYADAWQDVTIVKDMVKNIGEIRLQPAGFEGATPDSDQFLFNEDEILDDEGMGQSVGTIQGATDDIYYQTSNYDFSVARFRWRGYDTNWNAGYINGIYFNDAMRGRFNFSGLGGMTSSAFRNRSTDIGLAASAYGYGSLGGSSNFTTYASEYAPGFRGNLSYTNSNYMLRAMLQYSTGLNRHGWAFSASIIGRYAPEGVIEGTFYNSLGLQFSLQKVFNDRHSLNLTAWAAPTQRHQRSRHSGSLRPCRLQSLQPLMGISRRQEEERANRRIRRPRRAPQLDMEAQDGNETQHRYRLPQQPLQQLGPQLVSDSRPASRLLPLSPLILSA